MRIYLDVERFLQRHLLSGSTNKNISSAIPSVECRRSDCCSHRKTFAGSYLHFIISNSYVPHRIGKIFPFLFQIVRRYCCLWLLLVFSISFSVFVDSPKERLKVVGIHLNFVGEFKCKLNVRNKSIKYRKMIKLQEK